ncbi:MAG: membrane protein insertase YidC [Gammaproteobacteria bacterium]|jgi:YidC/Oxa1 family membrane protein insertase|nr:membrane protein insertase YidC [Chromatiales bacterium]MDP6150175.1 membrane protein insertase YidC [Gammaproteobacteria bacterium]MDP7094428.1 membrane protein insertase YidC [Gammaproteobacteria bacterium]MDP7270977.1 membrane protein insertase YidC [Gammaproteobacteria bacterium]MDP7418906.1 membrane protein insertase YidC [Gammaproteobacteria bacterium]
MDNQRIILWVLFAGLAFLTWSKWQADNLPPPGSETLPLPVAEENRPAVDLPAIDGDSGETPAVAPAVEVPAVATGAKPASTIKVETDLLELEISTTGGALVSAQLKQYPKSKDAPDVPVQILRNTTDDTYVLGSGLVDGSQSGPTHLATLAAAKKTYTLAEGSDTLEVPLSWTDGNGISVEKIYRFRRGRYNIDLDYRIRNNSQADWRSLSYLQIRKTHNPPERSMFNVDSYSYNGPVVYDGEKYEKIDPNDLQEEPLDMQVPNGWIAAIEHHFLSAVVPPAGETYSYDARYEKGIYTVRASGPAIAVPVGAEATLSAQLFIGPKLQRQLEETAEGLELTVDYGLLAILAQPLFWLLELVHGFVGNWGWSIILVTFLIKAAFYKLTEASGRSMAKMRKLQPRLKALQERYKDDRQALSQHMMDLYKREKVNPAAGCLPMLIQIPFFIAFYWVLLESVEMRQAPFALWISDLSSRDPYFVLPLLMGVAMFVQQKLNPAPPDPVQAKVMTILPIMFTGFFAFFPSGLVLYWLTNSVLSVAQQWNINRKMHAD